MERFVRHTGRVLPLRRSSVDTDQIVPAEFIKRVTRSGFADALFATWRSDPDFVLNSPERAGATILVAGADFGLGSSREHAVWALQDHGFRVVIAERFGDIFRGNAASCGLLTLEVAQPLVERLWELSEAAPHTEVTVDLAARRLSGADLDVPIEVDPYLRWRLMEGLDDIAVTLRHEESIKSFERRRDPLLPRTQTR